MFSTLYWNEIYNPSWGGVIINKARVRKVSVSGLSKFHTLFQALKESHFRMDRKRFFLNKQAEDFTNAIFGNYLARDISIEYFMKSEK